MKGEFLLGFSFRFTGIWRVARSNASLWDFFSASMEDLCHCHMFCAIVGCSALDDLHHRRHCSTPFWSWRGIDLFSPVSASGVSSLWCLILTNGSNIYEKWIFVGNLFPVYSYLACCTVQCFLVRFFFCFDGRLVSLPYILCKLSVALHSFFHTIVKHVSFLLGVDVEMTCSPLSLHLAFYACDVWE